MFPKKICFFNAQRQNKFAEKGQEWAFYCVLDSGSPWCVYTSNGPLTKKEIQKIKEVVVRSMEIYHIHIQKPSFKLEETSSDGGA